MPKLLHCPIQIALLLTNLPEVWLLSSVLFLLALIGNFPSRSPVPSCICRTSVNINGSFVVLSVRRTQAAESLGIFVFFFFLFALPAGAGSPALFSHLCRSQPREVLLWAEDSAGTLGSGSSRRVSSSPLGLTAGDFTASPRWELASRGRVKRTSDLGTQHWLWAPDETSYSRGSDFVRALPR